MGLSLGLPNLIHIHIYIAKTIDQWPDRCGRMIWRLKFFNYFTDKSVSNLTNYLGLAAGRGCLPAELIQVELRKCKFRWVEGGRWGYKAVEPNYEKNELLKPRFRRFKDHRSRVGCDICFGPL